MKPRPPGRCGFLFVEILFAIILLSIVGLVASRLFVSTIRLTHAAGEAHTKTVRFESALRALRADVWGGNGIQLNDATTITITAQDLPPVEWSIDPAGTLRRTVKGDSREERRWESSVGAARFAVEAPELILHIPETRTTRGGELRFISQVQLAERILP